MKKALFFEAAGALVKISHAKNQTKFVLYLLSLYKSVEHYIYVQPFK